DDFPRVCVFAQPKIAVREASEQPPYFVAQVQADIPRLAAFLEERLGVLDQKSRGFTLLDPQSQATGVDDYVDLDSAIRFILARDPVRLTEEWAPTSEWDRALHYGLTTTEQGALSADISRLEKVMTEPKTGFDILERVAHPYATSVVSDGEIALLE